MEKKEEKPTPIQIAWIYNKALTILNKYKDVKMSDSDFDDLIHDTQEIYLLSKENEYCKKILLEVAESIDIFQTKKA